MLWIISGQSLIYIINAWSCSITGNDRSQQLWGGAHLELPGGNVSRLFVALAAIVRLVHVWLCFFTIRMLRWTVTSRLVGQFWGRNATLLFSNEVGIMEEWLLDAFISILKSRSLAVRSAQWEVVLPYTKWWNWVETFDLSSTIVRWTWKER